MMNSFCFGEVLWDILPEGKVPGGAPMNVCYHLNRLGHAASIISKIGNDAYGRDLIQFLLQQNIDTSLIQTDDGHPTGTVMATRHGNEMEYNIVQPAAWDFIDNSEPLLGKAMQAPYFICGSLAARNRHSAKTLFELLDSAQTKVIDINLRPPHFTKTLIEALLHKADILKLNDHELVLIAHWYHAEDSFEKQVLFISKKFSINTILITKGAAGAALYANSRFYYNDGYRVDVVDTIGSGDAFLAAFLSKYMKKERPEAALDFACRLGAFVAGKKGACPVYDLAELEH